MKRRFLHEEKFLQLEELTRDDGLRRLIVHVTDSVTVLIYDRTNEEILLVQQAREPMIREENPTGSIMECVAGRFDIRLGVQQLAAKEILEEAGIMVQPWEIEVLNQGVPMALSPGVLNERAYLCYVEINRTTKRLDGIEFGTDAGEHTKVIRIPVAVLDKIEVQDVRVFALVQHLLHRLDQERRGPCTNR